MTIQPKYASILDTKASQVALQEETGDTSCMPYALSYKQTADKRTSLRGACDEAISSNEEQIATLRSQ
ncbi:MAG: hypothetical protein ACK5L5_11025 [Bacteroidales bacterium]